MNNKHYFLFCSLAFMSISAHGQSLPGGFGSGQAQIKDNGALAAQRELSNQIAAKTTLNPFDVPDYSSLVSINESGKGQITLPVVNIKGRKLSLPISITYNTSGIKCEQQSSEVGLGWTIALPSITRDFGAFEPDYTSTKSEFKMENWQVPNSGFDQKLSLQNGNTINPLEQDKVLAYTGVADGKAPDNYVVNIPGILSNSFWNTNKTDGNPSFKMAEATPWKIDYTKQTFTVNQEISRINEINYSRYLNSYSYLNPTYNSAAAIGFLPYVRNNFFNNMGVAPNAAAPNAASDPSQWHVNPNEYANYGLVSYEDYKAFTLIGTDGTTYLFSRPVRAQKYLIEEDPFWSTLNTNALYANQGSISPYKSYGDFWKTDYIGEWLLTEIRSKEYSDINGNGIADDGDNGDWIRIEYTDATKSETEPGISVDMTVPKYRDWLNFTQTDKASALMKEKVYVAKITTPLEVVEFTNSERFDVDYDYFDAVFNRVQNTYQYNTNNTMINGLKIRNFYPLESRKYDTVRVKENISGNLAMVQNVQLKYAPIGSAQQLAVSDYLIIDNNKNFTAYDPSTDGAGLVDSIYHKSSGRGKTTLLGIEFRGTSYQGASVAFGFNYGFNPSYNAIHKYQIKKQGAFPSIRESLYSSLERWWENRTLPGSIQIANSIAPWHYVVNKISWDANGNATAYNMSDGMNWDNPVLADELGYYYDANVPLNGRDAWSLSSIILPYGGAVNLGYDLDSVDITSDRLAWADSGIVDYQLPSVGHYNNIAHQRNIIQDAVNNDPLTNCGSNHKKRLYREFYYLLNERSGGIRIKSLSFTDPYSNKTVSRTYKYGVGHYTMPPADFWNNYLQAHSAFIYNERLRHFIGTVSDPGAEYYTSAYGDFNDYVNSMARLVVNSRVDNSISSQGKLYYDFIDELNSDGSKTRRYYGRINNSILNVYNLSGVYKNGITDQTVNDSFRSVIHIPTLDGSIKGEYRDRINFVELLTANINHSKDIGLYRTDYIDANNTVVKTETSNYEFVEVDSNKISLADQTLPQFEYQVWGCSQNYLVYPQTPSYYLFSMIPDVAMIFGKLASFSGGGGGLIFNMAAESMSSWFLTEQQSGLTTNPSTWVAPLKPIKQYTVGDVNVRNIIKAAHEYTYAHRNSWHYNDTTYHVPAVNFKSHQSYMLRPKTTTTKTNF